MTTRRVVPDDRESWQRLWEQYLDFYRAAIDDQVTTATFRRLCQGDDGLLGLVAEDDRGQLVGLANLVFHSSTWSTASSCYLEDLFVDPEARGTGAARELITAIYGAADEQGADRTYWVTQEFNGAARSLYDVVAHRTSFIVYER